MKGNSEINLCKYLHNKTQRKHYDKKNHLQFFVSGFKFYHQLYYFDLPKSISNFFCVKYVEVLNPAKLSYRIK